MKKIFWVFLGILVASLQSPELQAENLYGKNFHLIAPNRFDPYIKSTKKFLDQTDRSYSSFYGGLGLIRQRHTLLTVKSFANQDEFFQARRKLGFNKGFVPAAFYSPHRKTAYVYNQGDLRSTLSSLLHEISHHYIREFIPEGKILPTCLDEGLAELMDSSPMQATGIKVDPQLHLGWGSFVSKAAAQNKLIPMEKLLIMSLGKFQHLSARTGGFPYAQCWAYCRFLRDADRGKWRPILLALLTRAEPRVHPNTLIQESLPSGETFSDYQAAWKRFAKNPR